MKKLIILLLLIAGACYGQQNATFNNLDIRNTTKLRGAIYPFGAVATSPINPAVHEVLMVNNSTFATCRMDFAEFADSIANHITVGGYWTEDNPDTIYTDYNVRVDSSFRMVYKDRYFGDISDYDFLGSMIYNDSIYCYNMMEDQGNGFWNVEMGGQTYNTNRTSDIIIQDAIISIETLAPSHSSSIVIDTNELHIDSDSIVMTGGKVRIDGDIIYGDTFWDDLTVPATQARIGATSKPAYDYDTLGLKWDNTPVDTTNQLVVLNYQIPHRWKDGTSIYLHVHYHQSSAADTCEWFKAQYKLTDRGENRAPAYTTIKTNNQTEYAYTSGSLHQIATFPAISTAGHTESCMLQIVLYCYSIADLYTYDMDVHFEIDKPGSDNQTP